MSKAQNGNQVKVHYTGTLSDGSIFDSSKGGEPLAFELGAGQMIPGFEQAVLGMEQGQVVTAEIPAEEAYGQRREDMMVAFPKSDFPDHISPELGMELTLQDQEGHPINVVVSEISEGKVLLDANHPLAGQDLTFEIELVEIA
ncbi:MAG: peptidylprolyl isomerase [Cytophagales bacterium]|nr:peptidylprolyl isomerase [Cytophagales bacterium]